MSQKSNKNNYGLVLTGGGARGAYQAGALKGLSEILGKTQENLPFQVLSGSSAGAINCSFLASGSESFVESSENLADIWEKILFSDIYKTDAGSLSHLGFRWARGLTFAGMGTSAAPNYLLDTAPLRKLIEGKIDFQRLHGFEKRGGILAINATHYQTGAAVTFFSESANSEVWVRNLRLSKPVVLNSDHIMASSAIPLFFPPVKVEKAYYGDGALRMKSPFSPAIHLGAKKIMAIGVRKPRSMKEVATSIDNSMDTISLSDIAGVLLNSVFLDSLNADLERLCRINRTLSSVVNKESEQTSLKPIDVMVIQPSEDLGELAKPTIQHFPKTVRYLLSGIGADGDRGSDLLSYLSFHPSYTRKLVQLGYEDALQKKEEILSFFDA